MIGAPNPAGHSLIELNGDFIGAMLLNGNCMHFPVNCALNFYVVVQKRIWSGFTEMVILAGLYFTYCINLTHHTVVIQQCFY